MYELTQTYIDMYIYIYIYIHRQNLLVKNSYLWILNNTTMHTQTKKISRHPLTHIEKNNWWWNTKPLQHTHTHTHTHTQRQKHIKYQWGVKQTKINKLKEKERMTSIQTHNQLKIIQTANTSKFKSHWVPH